MLTDHVHTENSKLPELFGTQVFNEPAMKACLSEEAFLAWKACVQEGVALDIPIADEIADAMKNWALERGATHFTHWFQPMTNVTAEKHDGFLNPEAGGTISLQFSGKELIRGEPDASSFPSGGLRTTFEARGYTAWDPGSFAFIKDGTLCIPTVFFSYSGEALDKKTPLLRSMNAVSRQAVRVLRLLGDTATRKVITNIGPEQEYFLVDKGLFNMRDDLIICGHTLFGIPSPAGQDMEDHYCGPVHPRVSAFMKELNEELWKLGVPAKTDHNERAPGQYEMAVVYEDANTACDHNQLVMELMKTIAGRHGLVCLLHEKPFAGINGSGKHDNWSLSTDGGENLFKPGKHPEENLRFLLFLSAFVKGVDEYGDLLRATVAFAGNDYRLGGNEAPPAIISIFLGSELSAIVDAIIRGESYQNPGRTAVPVGVEQLTSIHKDNTDRNRTSPMAFTGNKFEFRMVGSTQSVSGPNIALNAIMAEELEQFANELEAAEEFEPAARELIRRTLTEHQRIIFNGNGYDREWEAEARRRGLPVFKLASDALPAYIAEKNVQLFMRQGIYSPAEIHARYEIHAERYATVLKVEARTMVEMISRQILPAVSAYTEALIDRIRKKQRIDLSCGFEKNTARKLAETADRLAEVCTELQEKLQACPAERTAAMEYCGQYLWSEMAKARELADSLEALTEERWWPYPSYKRLLEL